MYCVHDLLEIDPSSIHADRRTPHWVRRSLKLCPWVVVRRGVISCKGQVLVGVRGVSRSQRFATEIAETAVLCIVTPASLITGIQVGLQVGPHVGRLSVLTLLPSLKATLADWSWGLAGSLGFYFATGRKYFTANSDIDILLYPSSTIPCAIASGLLQRVRGITDRVDILIETAAGAYSLPEYANGRPTLVCRTTQGPVIVPHPYPAIMDTP